MGKESFSETEIKKLFSEIEIKTDTPTREISIIKYEYFDENNKRHTVLNEELLKKNFKTDYIELPNDDKEHE
jgi:hypothetical protein